MSNNSNEKVKVKEKKHYAYFFFKRLFDIIFSFIGIIFLIPISVAVFFANLVTKNHGNLFFKNKRIGKNGKVINIYKYRSMCMNAEKVLEELMEKDPKIREEYLTNHKLDPDPRVTKVGKFIRKTSIDELPQLINVLIGNMSIVGPRPYLPREKDQIGEEGYASIIKCKPGITGLWQVSGRNDVEFDERVLLDIDYQKKRSFWFDTKILFRTVKVVLLGRGAK